jgi:hypothetical protein
LASNLQQLRDWNAKRKLVKMQLAMKSCVKFTLAGKRYKAGVLAAAKRAKELEKKGITWSNCTAEEIAQKEKDIVENNNAKAVEVSAV